MAPLARFSGTSGVLGRVGSSASRMIFPALTVVVASWLARPVRVLIWPAIVARWLSRLDLFGLCDLASAPSCALTCASWALSCWSLPLTVASCAVRSAVALSWRFCR